MTKSSELFNFTPISSTIQEKWLSSSLIPHWFPHIRRSKGCIIIASGNDRISGNFWGRKLSQIGEKIRFSLRKLSWIAHFCRAKECHAQNFAEKTFAYSHKTTKFTKVFSLESFLLYGIFNCSSVGAPPHKTSMPGFDYGWLYESVCLLRC